MQALTILPSLVHAPQTVSDVPALTPTCRDGAMPSARGVASWRTPASPHGTSAPKPADPRIRPSTHPSDPAGVPLFVYGTLRSGLHNHPLLGTSRFLGPCMTEPHFDMFSLGNYPGLWRSGHTAVLGELYWVDPPTLARLDELEGHPYFYKCEEISLAAAPRGSRLGVLATSAGAWAGPRACSIGRLGAVC